MLVEIGRRLLGELQLQDGQIEASLASFALAMERGERVEGFVATTYHAELLQAWAMAFHVRGGLGDAARATDLLGRAHAIFVAALDAGNIAALRCDALLTWIRALSSEAAGTADIAFEEAAGRYAEAMPAGHLARAELLLMRSSLGRKRGAAEADALETAGRSEWRAAVGREFRPPLTLLH